MTRCANFGYMYTIWLAFVVGLVVELAGEGGTATGTAHTAHGKSGLADNMRPLLVPALTSNGSVMHEEFRCSSYVQYGARDKFLSGVVGGRAATESVAIAPSAAGESRAKPKRVARETGAIRCEPSSREMSLTSH